MTNLFLTLIIFFNIISAVIIAISVKKDRERWARFGKILTRHNIDIFFLKRQIDAIEKVNNHSK